MGLRCTHLGPATSAMAETQRAASAIELSPDWIADANWPLGSARAGVATILIGGGVCRGSLGHGRSDTLGRS